MNTYILMNVVIAYLVGLVVGCFVTTLFIRRK